MTSMIAQKPIRTQESLKQFIDTNNPRAVFTTSFGLEDQVLTQLICEAGLSMAIRFVTLDTGRLFPETYDVWQNTEERYDIAIAGFAPTAAAVERWVGSHGINGFQRSIAIRRECCAIRKLEPLDRALHGSDIWITGLRAEQSSARAGIALTEMDLARGLLKLNPLHDWTRDELLAFATAHNVPLNPLHARGFASIGCAPCTRAIGPHEPERAGRWWWESESSQECGLHIGSDGRLSRRSESVGP